MIEVWYQVHVEGIGWSGWKVEPANLSEQQISKINNAILELRNAVEKIADAITKAFQPVVEYFSKLEFKNSNFLQPEKKKIYQSEYRTKSNLKNYGYMPNYMGRMFCIGNRGNYRRF